MPKKTSGAPKKTTDGAGANDLSYILALTKGRNVRSVQYRGFKVEFFPEPHAPMTLEDIKKLNAPDMPSDQEMLFYSSGRLDEERETENP